MSEKKYRGKIEYPSIIVRVSIVGLTFDIVLKPLAATEDIISGCHLNIHFLFYIHLIKSIDTIIIIREIKRVGSCYNYRFFVF